MRPFINCTATYTINGGTLTLPEVKEAMDEASRYSVNLDELMEKVGDRLAQLLQVDCAMITAGAAAALTHATSACVAGADPKYELGARGAFVLQAQIDLTTRRERPHLAVDRLPAQLVSYLQSTGQLLEERGVVLQ